MIDDILKIHEHRVYPLPKGPWVMRQTWHNLLFAHWPIPAEAMRALVPQALPLDTYGGQAWLGIVPFEMQDVHPRGLWSVPGLSNFPELNVRTYVTLTEGGVTKPGALTVTTQFRGSFRADPNEQVRFLTSIRSGQR